MVEEAFDLATVLAFQDVDSDAGYKIYEALASAGDAQAMTAAGYCKLEGIGELDIDEREAIRWLKLAAEHGDAEGIYKLALAYYTTYEEPGTNSDEKALELFSRSREKEHVEGAFMLGQMLLDKGDAASAVCARRGQGRLAGHWGARELLLNLLDEDAKARG
ncbi:hypothetical protein EMIHUDRAFT_211512 [Emiliania huxleyi CCMP1516]|uniref:Sel1 repeat family protein n=2 Tax=Emiliania huxleyi TaxID=2903 RepID=A0A0D3IVR5_EMIH1|nr:hypothetical protein EMIHUDRAFT_211512 [Emiliania huxleyi CCMP1516]EOD15350.1 hypothetical protein EMIHUDRAFT_211512 [Emiliania huxleyi CCMP1516]|eukprot:XP_005767779.1 hypothetical protein EMIHUDRAFT_211512 [Emiliania huxleyi CCMP1516]